MESENQNNYAESIAIIGGADGPTSVFVVRGKKKLSFKMGLYNLIHKYKRRKAATGIVAGAHTLEELVEYAKEKYGAVEYSSGVTEYQNASSIYKIKMNDNYLEIQIDESDTFGVSFSGSKKEMKCFQKIARDLYIYYGVSEDDIRNKTERYFSLLSVLSQ